MTTTPDQIAELIGGYTDLKQYFEDVRDGIEEDRQQLQQSVADYIVDAAASLPLAPNWIRDTKYFSGLCGGAINVETEIILAHSGLWSAYWSTGTAGSGTAKVVDLSSIAAEGIPHGGDLNLAVSSSFYGEGFRVLILNATISSNDSNGGEGTLYVLAQGCHTYTGWNRGQFKTQCSVIFNVLHHTGNIIFYPHINLTEPLPINADDSGKGWIYRQRTRTGFGGCHFAKFVGLGTMKVAIALPYIGSGDHKGNFVWAGSVGRYTHNDTV